MKTISDAGQKTIGASLPWLLTSYILGVAPHVMRLQLWIVFVCLFLAVLRLVIQYRGIKLPSRWLLVAMTGVVVGGVFFSYGTLVGRDAGIALLIVMLALKLLELKTLRDIMIIVLLTYFLLLTQFLYSQTIPLALYTVVVVLLLTSALIIANSLPGTASKVSLLAPLRRAGTMLLQAAPIMLLLFFLFPRISGPIWGLPDDAHKGRTGLSDSMSPGNISSLSQSDAIAFRVAFKGQIPSKNLLYWRGPILEYFDGSRWTAGRLAANHPELASLNNPVDYTVTLEPHNKPWLLALDVPAMVPPFGYVTPQSQLLSHKPVNTLFRYDMRSFLGYHLDLNLDDVSRTRNLLLPKLSNPRTRELADSWRAAGLSDSAIIGRALHMFRDQPFVYTLNPPTLDLSRPVDDFLFNTRRGFCEHYASSFVVLMRAAGIPARVVTGYQGGEINPLDQYLIVRQSDAHAWSEVWMSGVGWIRIDPTAAVSPLRIERGLGSALPDENAVPFMIRPDNSWIRQLRFSWDAVNNHWNQWVLGYSSERQKQFLSQFGLSSWADMTIGLTVAIIVALFILAFFMLRLPGHTQIDRRLRAYNLLCHKLGKIGVHRASSEGPQQFAERVATLHPRFVSKIEPIIKLYIELRYGQKASDADLTILEALVRRLRLK